MTNTQDNYYSRSSKSQKFSKKVNYQAQSDLLLYKDIKLDNISDNAKHPGALLLDSSLITATNKE